MSAAKTMAPEGARPLCMKGGSMPSGMHARVGKKHDRRGMFFIRRERRSLPLPEERMRQQEHLFQSFGND